MILSDIATFSRGDIIPARILGVGDNPVVAGGAESKLHTNRYNRIGETIAISSSGSAGYVSFWDCPIFVTDAFTVDVDENRSDKRYIFYLLKALQPQIMNRAKGSIIPHVYPKDVSKIIIPEDDVQIQHKVGQLLFIVDKIIGNNKAQIGQLQDIAKLIYDYWFVQFDFPDENGRPYKSSGGKMVYNDQLKQKIPEGWKVVKFSSIAKIISGFPFKSDSYVNNGKYKVITIKNVQDGSIDSSTANSIDSLPDNLPDECVLSIGDLLISLTGNVGRCGLVFESNLLLNQRVGKLVVDHELNKDFAISIISSLQQRKRMEQLSNGSSQANLSPIYAADFYIALPPQALLNKFNNAARPIRQLSLLVQQESKQLASLRDWLLPMLMNRQVKIKE